MEPKIFNRNGVGVFAVNKNPVNMRGPEWWATKKLVKIGGNRSKRAGLLVWNWCKMGRKPEDFWWKFFPRVPYKY